MDGRAARKRRSLVSDGPVSSSRGKLLETGRQPVEPNADAHTDVRNRGAHGYHAPLRIIDFLKTCFGVSGSPELTWMVVTVFGLIFNSDRDVLEAMVREDIDTILHVVRFIFEWEKVSAPVISVGGIGGEDSPAVYTDARREYVLAGLSCLVHILSVVTFPSDDLCMSCWHGLQRIENDFALVPEIVAYVNECFSKLAKGHRPELVVHVMLDNNYYETLFDHLFILRKADDIDDSWFPICTCRILPLFRCLISANHEFYYRFADHILSD